MKQNFLYISGASTFGGRALQTKMPQKQPSVNLLLHWQNISLSGFPSISLFGPPQDSQYWKIGRIVGLGGICDKNWTVKFGSEKCILQIKDADV